jgi:hypothetical protein
MPRRESLPWFAERFSSVTRTHGLREPFALKPITQKDAGGQPIALWIGQRVNSYHQSLPASRNHPRFSESVERFK